MLSVAMRRIDLFLQSPGKPVVPASRFNQNICAWQVRACCISALGKCIESLPSTFLDNTYLKYIGWMLFDPSPAVCISDSPAMRSNPGRGDSVLRSADVVTQVRLASVSHLYAIYNASSFDAKAIANFTTRFEPRYLEMILDQVHRLRTGFMHTHTECCMNLAG